MLGNFLCPSAVYKVLKMQGGSVRKNTDVVAMISHLISHGLLTCNEDIAAFPGLAISKSTTIDRLREKEKIFILPKYM